MLDELLAACDRKTRAAIIAQCEAAAAHARTHPTPFHRSDRFLAIPARWRREFLVRNPRVRLLAGSVVWADVLGNPIEAAGANAVEPETATRELYERFGVVYLPRMLSDVWPTLPDNTPPFDFNFRRWLKPAIAPFGGITVREKRRILPHVTGKRRGPRVRTFGDEYYRRLLRVWDAREGYKSGQYQPRGASGLKKACHNAAEVRPGHEKRDARIRAELYYIAFELIIGEHYSATAWDAHVGAVWLALLGTEEAYRRLPTRPLNRRRGAKRGAPRAAGGSSRHVCQLRDSGPAPKSQQAAEADGLAEEEAISLFRDLVLRSINPAEAAKQAGLSDHFIERMRDPDAAKQAVAHLRGNI